MIKNNVNEGIETVNKRTSKVITGWSCDSGMGVNTFLRAAATETASRGIRTALVELDLFHASTAYSMGMSHPTRNLETWISKNQEGEDYRDVKDFLLNSNIWSHEKYDDSRQMQDVVAELPQDLFLLTPSQNLDRFFAGSLKLKHDMPAFIIDSLDKLGFQAIFIDVPSELLMAVTPASLKLADEVVVLIDGQVAHCMYTAKELNRLSREIENDRIKLVLNRTPQPLVKVIEKLMEREVFTILPEDPTMAERSLDLLQGGGDDFNSAVSTFIDNVGFPKKKKTAAKESPFEESREGKENGVKGITRRLFRFTKRV
ncbi:hypothetical protein [Paenibacillus sp. FSL K6-2859]|uniref:hypothetical protein n=1 Tax=Paenibacillus sp. FSL K6-2859 TaxID=2921482 RepID=UPI0030F8C03D